MKLKKSLYLFAVIFILSVFVLLMLHSTQYIRLQTSAVPTKAKPTVIIDAGHGGGDGGAVSADGVLEKGINLSIAHNTEDLLRLFGFETQMTREDDSWLTGEGQNVRQRKLNDMKARLSIFNSSERNVVISIHQNKFSDRNAHGTQVFYSPNNENSLLLADSIKNAVKSALQPDNDRLSKPADAGIYLLKNTENPAVIVECGFLSNADECRKLTDDDYQKKMSLAIATGFMDYFHSN